MVALRKKDAPTPEHRGGGGMLHDVTIVFVDVRFVQGVSLF